MINYSYIAEDKIKQVSAFSSPAILHHYHLNTHHQRLTP